MSRLLVCLYRALAQIYGWNLDWSLPGCKTQPGNILTADSFSLTGKSLAVPVKMTPI